MKIYHYDAETGEYRGMDKADESPLEPGVFHIPSHATDVAPPAFRPGFARIFADGEWKAVEDHRGAVRYDPNGKEVVISDLGPVGAELTIDPPKKSPNALRAEKRAALKDARDKAHRRIDTDVEAVRAVFLTPGAGQMRVYEMKRREAEGFLAGEARGEALSAATYPMLFARAVRLDKTPREIATEWKAKAEEWSGFAVALENVREDAKLAIDTARNAAEVDAVLDDLAWLGTFVAEAAGLSDVKRKARLRKYLKGA